VSRWRQPWISYDLDGRRVALQIVDPSTAFELERSIVAQLGETLALLLAAPWPVLSAIGRSALADADQAAGLGVARSLVAAADRIVAGLPTDPAQLLDLVDRLLLGRLVVDGAEVETWADMSRARLGPSQRWRLLGMQISQTFAELWIRAPYDAKAPRGRDYGVPEPSSPRAVAWAAALAREGYASSTTEILDTWTPLRMIELVEVAAHNAEVHRRATEPEQKARR
jgi:hypothetical protein